METATVIASKEQLESVGIDERIGGLTGEITGYYKSGYVAVKLTHNIGGYEFTNEFDIPKYWLNIKNNEVCGE